MYLQAMQAQHVLTGYAGTACTYRLCKYSMYLQAMQVQLVLTGYASTACTYRLCKYSMYLQAVQAQHVITFVRTKMMQVVFHTLNKEKEPLWYLVPYISLTTLVCVVCVCVSMCV